MDMDQTWTCNPDEDKAKPAAEESYHHPLPSERESLIYKPPPPLSPIPEVPLKQDVAGDPALPEPAAEPMDEAEDDALELHYPLDPAFEVEVEANNTWRIDDAPVDPGPRPVLKRGPPQEEVFPKPRSATKICLKNTPERWSPPRKQLPKIPVGDGFVGRFTATMRQVVNKAYAMPEDIRIGRNKGCNCHRTSRPLFPCGGLMTTLLTRT